MNKCLVFNKCVYHMEIPTAPIKMRFYAGFEKKINTRFASD